MEEKKRLCSKAKTQFWIRFWSLCISLIPLFVEFFIKSCWMKLDVSLCDVLHTYITSGRILFIGITIMAVTTLNIYIEKKVINDTLGEKTQKVAIYFKNIQFAWLIIGMSIYLGIISTNIIKAEPGYYPDLVQSLIIILMSLMSKSSLIWIFTILFVLLGFITSICVNTWFEIKRKLTKQETEWQRLFELLIKSAAQ